jgi:hypothetical protein
MINPDWRLDDCSIIDALDLTWYFTPDVIRVFSITGVDPQDILKSIILDHGPSKGLDEGVHNVVSSGFEIQLRVEGKYVLVEDPYAW